MRRGRRSDGVDGFDDPVQGRVRSDGHVRAAEVVVDGSDDAGDVQAAVGDLLLLRDQSLIFQGLDEIRPLLPEAVCSGERSVASDDDQVADGSLDQVLGSLESSFRSLEFHAPG